MNEETTRIELLSGKQARIVMTDGDRTTIESPDPSPPGSTVRGRIEGISCEFRLKVRNCKREGDGYCIDGRLQNATRELKQLLTTQTEPGSRPS